MTIYRLSTGDVLRAHSYAGHRGWALVDRDADAPAHALARYERRGQHAYLVREASGDLALVSGAATSGVTVARVRTYRAIQAADGSPIPIGRKPEPGDVPEWVRPDGLTDAERGAPYPRVKP